MKKIIIIVFLNFFNFNTLYSQVTEYEEYNHSSLEITSKQNTFYKDNFFFLGIDLKLEKGWKTYWKNPGDSGEPINVEWIEKENISSHEILFPAPKRYIDYDITTIGYEKKVLFPIKIGVVDPEKPIKGVIKINYLVCKEICLPLSEKKKINFFDIKETNTKSQLYESLMLIPSFENKYLKINEISKKNNKEISLNIQLDQKLKKELIDVFTFSDKDSHESIIKIKDDEIGINLRSDNENINSSNVIELLVTDGSISEKVNIYPNELSIKNNILKMVFFALLGGLILNFMPCVLPVLSIKIFSFMNLKSDSVSEIYKICLLTILGIITSFLILSIFTIILKEFGLSLGWGIHFQSKEFLIIFSVILIFFSFNLFGFFEIGIPKKIVEKFNLNSKNKYFDAFFSGILATTLATPCSAPFLGTSVGFALSQSNLIIVLIFLTLGLGFSLPYFIIMISPKLLNFFPKPGNWMITFKQLLALLVLITALWLLRLFGIEEIFLFILFIAIPISSIFFHKNYNNLKNSSFIFSLMLILSLLFWGLDSNYGQEDWKKFEEKLILEDINNNNLVFVDITADWCITCQVNKITTLENKKVSSFFKKNNVILYRGDWTNKNSDILEYISKNDRFGIPFNIFYGPSNKSGIVLSEILNKDIIFNSLDLVK